MDKEKSKREKWIYAFGGHSGCASVCLETEIITSNPSQEPEATITLHIAGVDEGFSGGKCLEASGLAEVQMLRKWSCSILDTLATEMAPTGVPARGAKHESVSGHEPPPPEIQVIDSPDEGQKIVVIITDVPKRRGKVLQVLQMVMGLPAADAKELLSSIPARIICPGEDAAKVLLATLSQAGCGCEIKVEPQEDDEELF